MLESFEIPDTPWEIRHFRPKILVPRSPTAKARVLFQAEWSIECTQKGAFLTTEEGDTFVLMWSTALSQWAWVPARDDEKPALPLPPASSGEVACTYQMTGRFSGQGHQMPSETSAPQHTFVPPLSASGIPPPPWMSSSPCGIDLPKQDQPFRSPQVPTAAAPPPRQQAPPTLVPVEVKAPPGTSFEDRNQANLAVFRTMGCT